MEIKFLPKAEKAYLKLPPHIRQKTQKSIGFLLTNPKHPSLNLKKKKGYENIWEARIDRNYRFTFIKDKELYVILTMGPHDVGLGKH